MNKIGIIGAMELEIEQLKKDMTLENTTRKAGMDFYEGTLNACPVVVVRCGIGKVNAAICTQILADVFQVSCVINTGVAGSLNATLDIGDILVSEDALEHDMDVSPLGYEPGVIPQLDCSIFQADERLKTLALTCCQSESGYSGSLRTSSQRGSVHRSQGREGASDFPLPRRLCRNGRCFHRTHRLPEWFALRHHPCHFRQG